MKHPPELQNQARQVIGVPLQCDGLWPKDRLGRMTVEGWRQALEDGERLLAQQQEHIREIERTLTAVRRHLLRCQ